MVFIMYPRQASMSPRIDEHQRNALICIWMLFVISSVVMILRFISQFKILRTIRADDILMTISWLLQAGKVVVSTIAIYWGLGRYAAQLSGPTNLVNSVKFEMYSMLLGMLGGMFGRVAFAVFLLYFIRRVSRPRMYMIWSIIAMQVIFNVFCIIYNLVQCGSSIYNLDEVHTTGKCWTSGTMLALIYAQGAINAASNLALSFLGLSLVLQIHVPIYAKFSLGILLSFSLLATIAEVVVTIEVEETVADGADYTYRLLIWNYWFAIENAVIIITSSLPVTRPVLLVIGRKLTNSRIIKIFKKWMRKGGGCCMGCFRPKDHSSRHMKKPLSQLPQFRFLDNKPSRMHSNSSISIKDGSTTVTNNCSCQNQNQNHSNKHDHTSRSSKNHHRHLSSNKSGLSSFSPSWYNFRSTGSAATGTTTSTGTGTGLDSMDVTNLDCPCSSTLGRDFVPVSSSRLAFQTVISAGDPSIIPPDMPLPHHIPPRPPPAVVTPTNSVTSNGKHRSNRRRGGHPATNAPYAFLRSNNNTNNTNNSNNEGSVNTSTASSHHHHRRHKSSGSFPILQTSHFSIEYEDENNNSGSDGSRAKARSREDDCTCNRNNNNLNSVDEYGQQQEFGNARPVNRRYCSQGNMSNVRYNEDDANALQLHDVGSILKDSQTDQR